MMPVLESVTEGSPGARLFLPLNVSQAIDNPHAGLDAVHNRTVNRVYRQRSIRGHPVEKSSIVVGALNVVITQILKSSLLSSLTQDAKGDLVGIWLGTSLLFGGPGWRSLVLFARNAI
jgi:hypothetical protein